MQNRRLFWVITNKCNLRCKNCYYNTGLEKRKPDKLNIAKAKKIIKQLPRLFDDIVLTGGEPLVFPSIMELIALLKQEKLRISLLTNGVLLNKNNCKKLVSLGVNSVSISLDSLFPSVNDLSRGKTKIVLRGINNLLLEKPKDMNITILQGFSRGNISSIKPLVNFCKRKKLLIWLNPIQTGPESKQNIEIRLESSSKEDQLTLKNEMTYWTKYQKKQSREKYLRSKKYIEYCLSLINGKKPRKITCPMGSNSFVLDVDGKVYPCFLRKDIVLGNIYDQKLSDILSNPEFKSILTGLKNAPCVQLGCVCFAS